MRLVGELKKLPGIGERTALRLAFHLLKSPQNLTALSESLCDVRDRVHPCSTCFAITETDPCSICSGNRDSGVICVVENSQDLMALERKHFCSLLEHPKSQERIMGLLQTGKPVRN